MSERADDQALARALAVFDAAVLESPSDESVLRAAARLAVDHLGVDLAIAFPLRPGQGLDRGYACTSGEPLDDALRDDLYRAAASFSGRRRDDQEPGVLTAAVALRRKEARASWRCFVAPIRAGATPRALLAVLASRRPGQGEAPARGLSPASLLRALDYVAARAGAALATASQQSTVQRQLADQASLNKVTLALASAAHGRDLLDLIVRSALHLSGARACSLFVLDAHGMRCAARVEESAPEHVAHDLEADAAEARVASHVLSTNAQVLTDARGEPLPHWGPASPAPFVVGLPVRYERQMLGVLCVRGPAGRGFTAAQVALLWVLCSHTAVTLENARLIDEERRRAHQAAALLDAATASGATLKLDDVLYEIVATTARLTGADRSSIFLLDSTGRYLRPAALYNMDESFVQRWLQHPVKLDDELLSSEAILTGQPVVVNDAERDPRTDKEAVRLFGDRSILVVPMQTKGEVIGTLWVNHVGKHYTFTDDDVKITVAIANQAAMAISNARLYAESQRKGEELAKRRLAEVSTILGVSTEIASILHIDAVLASVVRNVRNLLQVDACRLYRLPGQGGELVLAAQAHADDSGRPDGDPAALRRLAQQCLERREALVLMPEAEGVPSDYQVMVAAPLIARDTPLGVLCALNRSPHAFLDDEQQLIMAFANQAAVAIEHAALFESLRRRVRELSGLHELAMTMVALPELRSIIGHLTAKLGELLDVEHCAILLYDSQTHSMVAQPPAHGLTDEEASRLRVRLSDGTASARVWETGTAYFSNDAARETTHAPHWVRELNEHGLLLVPMRIGDTTIGLIRAANKRNGLFTDDDVRLLGIFASQAAAIVQHAILYDRVNRERDELDAILGNTSDSIFVFDLDGHLVRVNRAAETLFGVPPALGGAPACRDLFRCADLGGKSPCAAACIVARVAHERMVLPYVEHKLLSDDGRELDVTSSYTYVEAHGSEGPRVVVITRDISRLKEVERLKSDFVSMVSHELRTPLAIIKGYAATLLRLNGKVSAETELRWLRSIDESCDRLTRLIDNLLNVSRIESGRFTINPQPVAINEIVRRAVSSITSQAPEHVFTVSLPDDTPMIHADRDQTEQVLLNLLSNAAKYSEGGSAIEVGVREEGDWVVVSVKDHGPGIPAAQLPHLFEKFHRVEGPGARRASGSGLGLYICKAIIDAHQGRIWATSDAGGGSTFSFALRRLAMRSDVPAPADARAPTAS